MTPTTIAQISRLELQDLSTPLVATITDVKQLSPYNWIEARSPTIAVPGTPPLWSAPGGPWQLKKDSGLIYIAQNAARHPDKVTKNTAIFCRDETATQEFIGPDEFKGYGREFEKAYTTRQIGASTGHHRIVTYRFGGLNFIVRHETDGYVDTDTRIPSSDAKGPESDSLSKGQMISLKSTLELKTRVFHKRIEFHEVAPQLWISQTPKLVRAYHRRGTFPVPEVEDVAADIKTWEEGNQRDLRKLAALISKIIGVVKGCGGNALSSMIYWEINWADSEASSDNDVAAVKPVDGIESKPDGKSDTTGKHESATNCKSSPPWKKNLVEVLNYDSSSLDT
ncbi:hypothetical protein V501_02890 [Pseudogymnoascus sp. VKM F-4519 (FW-2642)]|nr:hypothetical protein V501_02890 [Pseudogymnoascus sp. VKM F-4519 (FW-2642)]